MNQETIALTSLFVLILLFILIFVFYSYKRNYKSQVNLWKKSLNLQEHADNFHKIYESMNGFVLSHEARENLDSTDFTYGEIDFLSFIAILSLAQPDEQTVFYDLGSGTGKAVLACAMVYPVAQSIGVELLPQLYEGSCRQKEQLATFPEYQDQVKKINFIHGSFLEADLSPATLIFINSTSFIGPTWDKLCARLDTLPQLKHIITGSKALKSNRFKVIKETEMQMSWGVIRAFIHAQEN